MSVKQYKTIFLKNIDDYPGWKIKETFEESSLEPFCERSGKPIVDCENTECAQLGTHKTRVRVGKVDKAIIYKEDTNEVP